MVINDINEERQSKNKYVFVSSEEELLFKLKKLNVDTKKVKFFDTKKPVKNWNDVAGVFKANKEIYAYSHNLKSELCATLQSI